MGRPGRARVRAPHGLRAVGRGLRLRVREGGVMSETGFMTMGRGGGEPDAAPIGVGMLGYAFMGKAHSNAYRKLAYMTWPSPLVPRLVAIAGRNEQAGAGGGAGSGFR